VENFDMENKGAGTWKFGEGLGSIWSVAFVEEIEEFPALLLLARALRMKPSHV
jgi:hypothetical protein